MPRRPTKLTTERLRELARSGAESLLSQLRAEIVAIERTFPELALSNTRRTVTRSLKAARTRGGQLSEEARQAVSRRMKKYWAERRKAKVRTK